MTFGVGSRSYHTASRTGMYFPFSNLSRRPSTRYDPYDTLCIHSGIWGKDRGKKKENEEGMGNQTLKKQ